MAEHSEYDRLLISYLMKELNTEEEAWVERSVKENAELRDRLSQYRNLFKALEISRNMDSIDLDSERKLFEQRRIGYPIMQGRVKHLDVAFESPVDESRPGKNRLLRVVAIAASLVFLAGIFWLVFQNQDKTQPVTQEKGRMDQSPTLLTRLERNRSGNVEKHLLGDGSEIILWNNSDISFFDPFPDDAREIDLAGKASFKVSKDPGRPFRVTTGGIITTAIGTEFIVTNFESDNFITVRLMEGKVMIKKVKPSETGDQSWYLGPGQELLYSKKDETTRIRKFSMKPDGQELAKTKKEINPDNPSIPVNGKGGSWYMFNNQSLPEVFDQLERIFQVEIDYNRKALSKIYFIGRFEKKDSLEYILRSITKMNKLSLTKKDGRFIIRK